MRIFGKQPGRARARAAAVMMLAVWLLGSTSSDAQQTHRVGPGQTIEMIAQRYRLSPDTLRQANHLPSGAHARPGQLLIIPEPTAKPARPTALARRPLHPGVITLLRGADHWTGKTLGRDGKLLPGVSESVRRMLRDYDSDRSHTIDARLIAMLTQVSDHFGGRPIEVVSGFRPHTETQHTQHSNHNIGHAVDFTIRDVPNEVLRDYCHTLKDVGVGYYPNSSFVHLDVRPITTHWVDESGPGERPRYSTVVGVPSTEGSSKGKAETKGAKGSR